MLHEVSFPSYNDRDQVQGWIYVPAVKPKGIVQLIHGFGEHSRRYFHMIVKFLDAGYIVVADDHVGHGKTAMTNDTWGDWGTKGYETMREDEHQLTKLVKEKYPNLPYFLFGHSMGSFITRDYIANYGSEITGAIICGTAGVFPGLHENQEILEQVINDGQGDGADSKYVQSLMGWMCERCDDVAIGNEWICHDVYVQKDHAEDPFDAFTRPVTNRSMLYFTQMMTAIEGTQWAEKVPKELPIYNIGGDQDPVGQYGEGIYTVSNWLSQTGHNVTTKVYPGYRHEIHNYADIKDAVAEGIIEFMDGVINKET